MTSFFRKRDRRVPVRLQLEALEDRVVPSADFTMPLVNQTGLNPAQYSIYVLGFSTASQMALQSDGEFASVPSNVTNVSLPSFNINTMPAITLNTALTGARLYFFVEPSNQPPPTLTYSTPYDNSLNKYIMTVTQPTNPPSSNYPPFDIVELTVPGTVDVQTVDGFIFPLTLTLNNNQGQVGQPVPNPAVNRQDILSAYTTFMNGQGAGGPYQALVFSPNIAGQAGGIVNPGRYLADGANSGSALNSVWDTDLNTLFTTAGRTLNMIGDDGAYYVGTPMTVGSQSFLQFVGYTENSGVFTPNGNVFNIYDPTTPDTTGTSYNPNESAGEQVFANDGVFADQSTNVMNGNLAPTATQIKVALGLERDIVSALNRGVALLGPSGQTLTPATAGDTSTYWGTETKWYPAGQTENLFSLFMHTGTVNGQPIFVLPSGAVQDAQGTLMGSAYGFAYDESPTHGPANQPTVPSEFNGLTLGPTTATITLGPWFSPVPATPPSSPSPSPSRSPFPSASPSPFLSPTEIAVWLALVEDQDASTVDYLISKVNASFTQAANDWFALCNDHFGLNNSVLGEGLDSLQSAIHANPYNGTLWGLAAEAIGLELAASMFPPYKPA